MVLVSGKCDEVMRQVMSHMKLEIPIYIRSRDPIFSHATPLNPAEVHTATQPLLKEPLSAYQDCENSDVKPLCDFHEVSASFGGPKVEIDDSEEVQVKTENSCDTFHFVSTVSDIGLVDNILDQKAEDPLALVEGQSSGDSSNQTGNTVMILIEENWIPNAQQAISSDSDPLLIEDGGLILDLEESLNYNQGICDQNSLQVEDIIVECSTSLNSEDISSLIGNNTHTSSISDSGASSIKGSLLVLDDPSSLFSISALTQVLQLEHSYSKASGNGSQATGDVIKIDEENLESVHSLGDDKRTNSCKRIKTNRTENPLLSSLPQSTKKLTGKLNASDVKQVCDDKYDFGNTAMCSFCSLNYSSKICLFYRKWTSKFENIPIGSRICGCCDTDEDDDTDADTGTCKTDGNTDSNKIPKVPNVNPGWYGKGYRKRTKRKKIEKT